MHILHLVHRSWLMTTAPAADLLSAPDGQTFMHAAVSHCMHIIGTETPTDSQVNTETREPLGLNS